MQNTLVYFRREQIHSEIYLREGGLNILLNILKRYGGDQNILETCYGAIEAILSSEETRSEFLTDDVLRDVQELKETHKGNKRTHQLFFSLKRVENSRVLNAISEGKCTNKVLPKC